MGGRDRGIEIGEMLSFLRGGELIPVVCDPSVDVRKGAAELLQKGMYLL